MHTFDDVQSASLYRNHCGGGLIFLADNGTATLYPPNWTADEVLAHAARYNVTGTVI